MDVCGTFKKLMLLPPFAIQPSHAAAGERGAGNAEILRREH
jgi:hypothetical protein